MNAANDTCYPLTLTRALAMFPIGNQPLSAHQERVRGQGDWRVHPQAWIGDGDRDALLDGKQRTLISSDGEPLAWRGDEPDVSDSWVASDSFLIVYPWDLLRANESYVGALGEDRIDGDVHGSAVVEGRLVLGRGSRILPGVFIEGHVIIGENCKIGPNCYLRGATSIGDRCHIGQAVEIKNSIILSHTQVGHLSYVGDSILGEKVNFGAGTIVSNLRHDGKNHRSMIDGVLVDTGRRKLGAIIGDGVHTGIHTSIYPGRKLWPGATTRPGEVVDKDRMVGGFRSIDRG